MGLNFKVEGNKITLPVSKIVNSETDERKLKFIPLENIKDFFGENYNPETGKISDVEIYG